MARDIPIFFSGPSAERVADDGTLYQDPLPESFLHGLWMKRRFKERDLHTVDGISVEILRPGRYNRYEKGPDFKSAIIRLGGEIRSGDIECHTRSSDWIGHRHEGDSEYNHVMLHVALLSDDATGNLRKRDGTLIPEVVLHDFLDQSLRSLLHGFRTEKDVAFPCSFRWREVPPGLIRTYTKQLSAERLAERIYEISRVYSAGTDWENILYQRVLTAMGYTENASAMTELARRVPMEWLHSQPDTRIVEAFLLGTAGLLPSLPDLKNTDRETADFVIAARERFQEVSRNHLIHPMPSANWHFRGLRPSNFPHRRIAQAARLIDSSRLLGPLPFERIIESVAARNPVSALRGLMDLDMDEDQFWNHHAHLRHASAPLGFSIGKERRDIVLNDAVLPVLAAFAEQNGFHAIRNRVEYVLQKLPARVNRVTQPYVNDGYEPQSLWEAQGLQQMAATRCATASCLHCRIGSFILRKDQ